MSNVLIIKLPKYIVDIIKLYTGEGCWRNGKYIHIHRIPKDDCRYKMLLKRPKIKQICYDSSSSEKAGCVWFKLHTGKFIVINVKYGYYWNGVINIRGTFMEIHYNQTKTMHVL
jgi:hypothetical protein